MKRFLALVMAGMMIIMTAACAKTTDSAEIRIAGLKGPTSIGMVELMRESDAGQSTNHYHFSVYATADEVTPQIIRGDLDIAAVPANLAAVLYNKTEGKIKLLAINTLGVLDIVESGDTIRSMQDLKGRTIYATAKGSAPEYALRYLLQSNGIDPDKDVTIEWKSEPTEIVSVLASDSSAVAMLPQPYVTAAIAKVSNLHIALDLNQVWQDSDADSQMVTGVLIVRSEFADAHPDLIRSFLAEYKTSTEYANSHVDETADLVGKYDIFAAEIAKKAIPACNITYIDGQKMRDAMEGYLGVLYKQNPQSVGGSLPGDDFYYSAAS